MSTRRFIAFTGIRADYDLLSDLYARISEADGLELGLIVSGAHLSWSYGYTVRQIEADGLPMTARIESLLDADTLTARVKSAAILLQSALEPVARFDPTAILVVGDREDAMVAALTGAYLGIPTVHFFGGDHASDGNVDNAVRHAISKLTSVHFVIHPSHRERLLRIGEHPDRIFVVGSPALDKFVRTENIAKSDLLNRLGRPAWDEYALVVYHPILGLEDDAGRLFAEVLDAVGAEGLNAFVGYPTADAGSRQIFDIIEERRDSEHLSFYRSLDRELFINLMRHARIMVGNSSAGVLEAASVQIPVVNVGLRQRSRLAAENVIFVDDGVESVREGIQKALAPAFADRVAAVTSPYGDGRASERILELLKSLPFDRLVAKGEDPLA